MVRPAGLGGKYAVLGGAMRYYTYLGGGGSWGNGGGQISGSDSYTRPA